MSRERVLRLLECIAAGTATPAAALEALSWLPVETVGDGRGSDTPPYARLDHHRSIRQGFPEVVFGEGKAPAQIVGICGRLAARGEGFLATRLSTDALTLIEAEFDGVEINEAGRTAHLPAREPMSARVAGPVLVVTGGTSDLPVAEEAASCAVAFGNPVERLYDVGVAGLHRLLGELDALRRAAVIIAIAGMEGALPSVVGGLVRVPVIAVPTSVGYGAALGGFAALFGMLSSCASGLVVVNIDNGFGAASAATRINQLHGPVP